MQSLRVVERNENEIKLIRELGFDVERENRDIIMVKAIPAGWKEKISGMFSSIHDFLD